MEFYVMAKSHNRYGGHTTLSRIGDFLLMGGNDFGDAVKVQQGGEPWRAAEPFLANILLDQLDRELGRRGHRFVRYVDDVSIYGKSERAGRRVLQSISDFLIRKLKLKVNDSKSRVDKPRNRSLLGFSIGRAGQVFVSDKSIRRLKDRIRELTGRNRGRRIEQIIREVADYLRGWMQYFNYAYNKQKFRELTAWINRRLRCYMWKQWGRAGYRELRKRGVSRQLAWNTSKSHHGPWRFSRSPALSYALTTRHFAEMGLPLLHVNV
jgi:RNA-directed DNA polymerase